MNYRLGVLLVLLAATLVAGRYLGEEDVPENVHPVTRHPPRALAARPVTAARAVVAAVRFPGGGPDLFPAISWRPPPPPPVKVESLPPPPPQAPPLPFKFVGRWSDEQGETVFLAQGEQVLSARAGQSLQQWRLDTVSADKLAFTYLPLNLQSQLRLTP